MTWGCAEKSLTCQKNTVHKKHKVISWAMQTTIKRDFCIIIISFKKLLVRAINLCFSWKNPKAVQVNHLFTNNKVHLKSSNRGWDLLLSFLDQWFFFLKHKALAWREREIMLPREWFSSSSKLSFSKEIRALKLVVHLRNELFCINYLLLMGIWAMYYPWCLTTLARVFSSNNNNFKCNKCPLR